MKSSCLFLFIFSSSRLRFCAKIALFFLFCAEATFAGSSGISYQGRIIKPDGTPLESKGVQFRIQVRSPGSENCLLYEESQSIDMSSSAGLFSLTINDGTGTRLDVATYPIDRIFANRGTMTLDNTRCVVGTTYTPNSGDGRKLIIYFKDDTLSSFEPMPILSLNFSPQSMFALESQKVGDFAASNLLRSVDAGGNPAAAPALDPTQLANLTSLLAGTSTQYAQSSAVKAFATTTLPTCGANEALKGNGTALSCVPVSSGSSSYSSISAATGTNTIDNLNFAQNWNWSTATTQSPMAISANALTTGSAMSVTTTSAALNSSNGLLNIANTGASTTGTLARFQANATAGSGLTILSNGNVGIGTTTPAGPLQVVGGTAAPATNGASISLSAQSAGTGNQSGGFVNITPGSPTGTGSYGSITLGGKTNAFFNRNNVPGPGFYGMTAYPVNTFGDLTGPLIGLQAQPTLQYANGTQIVGVKTAVTMVGTGFSVNDLIGFHAAAPITTFGPMVTNSYGLYVDSMTSATNNWAVFTAGTTPSSFGGNVGIGSIAPAVSLDLSNKNDSVRLPAGTTAQRPGTPVNGDIRYNSETQSMEAYVNGAWARFATIQATTSITAPAGSGYFVLSGSTWNGNLGGLAGADAKCLTELTATNTNWKGYAAANTNGQLTASKIHAFICDMSTCTNLTPLASYYFAVANDATAGGAVFTADASGGGPADSMIWSAANYFNGANIYYTGRTASSSTAWSTNPNGAITFGTVNEACNGWIDSSGSYTAIYGSTSNTDGNRWRTNTGNCSVANKLICIVNP